MLDEKFKILLRRRSPLVREWLGSFDQSAGLTCGLRRSRQALEALATLFAVFSESCDRTHLFAQGRLGTRN